MFQNQAHLIVWEQQVSLTVSIDLIWTKVQISVTAIGGWPGYYLGGVDGMMKMTYGNSRIGSQICR